MRKLKKKEEGGPGPKASIDTSARSSAYMVDNLNQILTHGAVDNKILRELNPTEGSLMMQAYLWSKRGDQQGRAPTEIINSFYNRPADSSNPVDYARQSLAKIGYGPDSMYHNTPNANVTQQKMGGTMKKRDMGGPNFISVGPGTSGAAASPDGYLHQAPTVNGVRQNVVGGANWQQPGLAQMAAGPANIPDWASNMSQGFMHNSANLPQNNPQMAPQQTQQVVQQPNQNMGARINWNHVLQSNLLLGLGQGLANAGPNSQQNAVKRWNTQQFNPMHYLPYTASYSTQDRFGDQSQMKKGGLVKKEDGGFTDMNESMRKWILNDDEPAPVIQEAQEESPQAAAEDDSAQQAAQFNMFVQMFGWDAADQEQEPQEQMKKGGAFHTNPAHRGWCTPMSKSTCTGKRRAFAETMKKHHGFHPRKALGGSVGDELDVSPEEYQSMIQQGYTFE